MEDKGLKTEEIVVSDTQGRGWEKRESRESVSERHKKMMINNNNNNNYNNNNNNNNLLLLLLLLLLLWELHYPGDNFIPSTQPPQKIGSL